MSICLGSDFSGTDFHGVDLFARGPLDKYRGHLPPNQLCGRHLSDGVAHGVILRPAQGYPDGTDHLQGQNLAYARDLSGVQLVGANAQKPAFAAMPLLSGMLFSDRRGIWAALIREGRPFVPRGARLSQPAAKRKLPGIQAGVPPRAREWPGHLLQKRLYAVCQPHRCRSALCRSSAMPTFTAIPLPGSSLIPH